jgi:glycosyltransferase involved in cell wall biosynthesis
MHGLDFWAYTISSNVPVLVTLHLPITWYPSDIAKRCPSNRHLQSVSETQRATFPPELRDSQVIPNGVEIPPFPDTTKSNFAIAMGRICPEKNLHAALEAGTLAQTTVLLAGQVFPYEAHQQYFCEKVVPLLGKHRFLGPVVPPRKEQLLAQAKCLLHPTLAPETSSLVAMEAMAAGTPVIAFRSGALTEIVEDGVTGFLVNSIEEMAQAIRKVDAISPRVCWEAANRRFSKERMVQQYFRLYRNLLATDAREQRCA